MTYNLSPFIKHVINLPYLKLKAVTHLDLYEVAPTLLFLLLSIGAILHLRDRYR